MNAVLHRLAILALCLEGAGAVAADTDKAGSRGVQEARACEGVNNENTKTRELRRELGAYLGQTIPEDLERRVKKHVELVAKLKADCEQQQRDTASLPR